MQNEKQSENKENEKITANQKKQLIIVFSYKLKWVPEGYKKETGNSDEKDLYWYYMTYSNEKGDLIIYNQHDADYVIQMAF